MDMADGVTVELPSDVYASIDVCGFIVELGPFSESTHTCGSLTTTATAGQVSILTSDGARVDVPTGSTVTVVDDDTGVSIEVLVGAVTVTVGDLVIDLTEDDDPLLNPGDLVGDADSDGDGLTDAEEALTGTNPGVADTDGDGLVDGIDASWLYAYVDGLPRSAFRSVWTEFLTKATIVGADAAVRLGQRNTALSLIDTLDSRSNGCGATADGNDWITDCDAQAEFQGLLALYRRGVATMELPIPRWWRAR
jgi:hypothetical protein